MSEPERLQKFLARAGIASRRQAERLIVQGLIKVNGEVVTELGTKVTAGEDRVEFDGRQVHAEQRFVYLLVNKPQGVISSAHDPEGRPIVTQLVPSDYGRVYPVGRLDWDSEGAVILTNDGELTNLLTHPRHEFEKTYLVKVEGIISDNDSRIAKLRDGVKLDDGYRTKPATVVRDSDTGKHTWFIVGLKEGKNRQIRRMFESIRRDVKKLRRIAYGPVILGDLPPGDHRRLNETEIEELYAAAGGKRPALSASRGRLPADKREAKRAARKAANRAARRPRYASASESGHAPGRNSSPPNPRKRDERPSKRGRGGKGRGRR